MNEEFNERIAEKVADLRRSARCARCKDPTRKIRNKSRGLCCSCNNWELEYRRLEKQVAELPPEQPKDPHWRKRWEWRVAKAAIDLCQEDGSEIECRLLRAEPADIERLVSEIARKTLKRRRSFGLILGLSEGFAYFSTQQRILIWHFLFRIISATRKRDRRRMAIAKDRKARNDAAD